MSQSEYKQIHILNRITFRLALYFVLLSVLPILVVVFSIVSVGQQRLTEQILNQMNSVAELKQNQVNNWISETQTTLEITTQTSSALTTTLVNAESRDTIRQLASESLDEIASIDENIATLYLYDLEGNILAASSDVLIGRIVSRQSYFTSSLETLEHVEPPYYAVGSQDLTIIITRQILNEQSEVMGILAAQLDSATLASIMLDRTGLGNTGETYLVSSINNYLLTPSRFEGYPQNRAYTSTGIDDVLQGNDGRGIYDDYRGISTIGSYIWIPEIRSGLMVEIDTSEGLQTIREVFWRIGILTLVIAGLALGAGLLSALSITNPIIKLTQVADQFSHGDLSTRADVYQNNEIGLLADTFNGMADRLQIRQEELQVARDEALLAKQLSDENSRLKSEFLSMMSHELRTPMNAIEGFTSIILSKMGGADYNEKSGRYLKKIKSNSQRLLGLINDFLDLSRIESGRLELAHMPIKPRDMIQKWYDNLFVLAENKGLKFDVTVDPLLPDTIYGDEESLSKIAINLLGNAIKFTEEGSVQLELNKRDNMMALIVTDTGVGIPPHAREFVFDEFRQVDMSSKREKGGTGLGLSIVQKLARAMGGNVSLESEVNKGSTFEVLVPIHIEPELERV